MGCDHGNKTPNNLTALEAEQLFAYVLSGQLNDTEIAEILQALKDKGETKDEIVGAIRAILQTAKLPKPQPDAIDVCGTGGDGLSTLNISTAVSLVVAGAGVKVAKHGNKAVSSNSGSSDVLAELGLKMESDAAKNLAEIGFGYFHAPLYYPALKTVAGARAKVGRSIFNLLGPLLNPVGAKRQLIGVFSPYLLQTYAKALRELGSEKAWVVCGENGLDEISISGPTEVVELDKGAIDIFVITPEDAGLPRHQLESIKGGDAKHNAHALKQLLVGAKSPYRDVVLLNASAALLVAGKASNLVEGVQIAANSIDSKAAKGVLERLKDK